MGLQFRNTRRRQGNRKNFPYQCRCLFASQGVEKLRTGCRKIIEEDRAATLEVPRNLGNLFFSLGGDAPSIESIRDSFAQQRRWPVLEAPGLLRHVISAGVEKGIRCLFRFSDSTAERPDEIHGAQNQVPLTADLSDPGWSLVSVEKVRARGWITGQRPSGETVPEWAVEVARRDLEPRVSAIME